MPIQFDNLNLPPPHIRLAAPDDEYRGNLIKRVIKNKKKLPGGTKGRVVSVLKETRIRVGSFRDASQAPAQIVVNTLLPQIFNTDEDSIKALTAIWDAWAALHAPLHDAVAAYAQERGLPTRDIQADIPKVFSAAWHDEEVNAFLADFPLDDEAVSEADVRVMFCWLTDIIGLPEEAMHNLYESVRTHQAFVGTLWDDWLSDVEEQSIHDPNWEQLPALVGYLRTVDAQTSELHTAERREARETLAAFADTLDVPAQIYYDLQDKLPLWTVNHIPVAELDAACDLLKTIRARMDDYERLLSQQDKVRDIVARREMRSQIESLENQLIEQLGVADTYFMPVEDSIGELPAPPEPLRQGFGPQLDALLVCAPDDPIWEELPTFIALLEERIYQHAQQDIPAVGSLADTLQDLLDLGEETLGIFDLNVAFEWNADAIPPGETDPTTHILEQMLSAIREYNHLDQQRPESFEDRRHVIHQKGEVADQIAGLKAQLQQTFDTAAADQANIIAFPNADALTDSAATPMPRLDTDETFETEDTLPMPPSFDALPPSRIRENASTLPNAPMHPSELAEIMTEDASPESWADWLWSLIEYGDLPAAYWLARAIYDQGRIPPLPRQLVAAVQGSYWLQTDFDQGATTLSQIVDEYEQNLQRPEEALMGVAAALRAAALAPASRVTTWLQTPEEVPSFHAVVEALQQLTTHKIAIQPQTINTIADDVQQETQMQTLMDEADAWLETAPNQRNKLLRAEKIWIHLVREGGDIHNILKIVIQDSASQQHNVKYHLEQKYADNQLDGVIDDLDHKLHGAGVKQIEGTARKQLKRDINYANHFARRWLNLTQAKDSQNRNWQLEQVRALRGQIEADYPMIVQDLQTLTAPDQPRWRRACGWSLRRSLDSLAALLSLEYMLEDTPPVPQALQPWDALVDPAVGLLANLELRLLWLPGLRLKSDGSLGDGAQEELPLALQRAYEEDWQTHDAVWYWVNRQDFRFIDDLMPLVDDLNQRQALEQRIREEREGVIRTLSGRTAAVSEKIEQAFVDGIITQKERIELSAQTSIDVEAVRHFDPLFKQLKRLRHQLNTKHDARLRRQQAMWDDLHEELKAQQREHLTDISERMENILQTRDTRLIDESLSQLRVYNSNNTLDPTWFLDLTDAQTTALEHYLGIMEPIENELSRRGIDGVLNKIDRRGRFATLDYRLLKSAQRKAASEALVSWREMKERQTKRTENHPARLAYLLGFLGFDTAEDPIQLMKSGEDWLYYRVRMRASAEHIRPIPNFGSQTAGQHDIVCIWDRPDVSTLNAALNQIQTSGKNIIVLYFGRVGRHRWQDVLHISRERDVTLAILDETLLTYLTAYDETQSRLADFFRCTLPFTIAAPYTADQPGRIPPEMFFGREEPLVQLTETMQGRVVFGGRRLGKTALLHRARRAYHHPPSKKYATVIDLSGVSTIDRLWTRLRTGLLEAGLLPVDTPASDVPGTVNKLMQQDKERRILALFDNADAFLKAEAGTEQSFSGLAALQDLGSTTNQRFNVVFAGQDEVQRFHYNPAQNFTQPGQAIRLSTLSPADAQQLVRQPLERLGYRISDSSVLRILSYTNYHPGLLQLFCAELLRQMRAQQTNQLPPYRVERQDVETVHLRTGVQRQIRERFDWTLELDQRYQAIAWALIVEQMEQQDNAIQAYSPRTIETSARLYWPEGFEDTGPDHFRALLNEMVGLDTLTRDANGDYSLRSPNLVRLMGSGQEIDTRLLELAEETPRHAITSSLLHALLDEQIPRYSLLSVSQERLLMQSPHGRALMFVTRALGLENLPATLAHLLPASNATPPQHIPDAAATAEALPDYLRQQRASAQPGEHRLLYRVVSKTSPAELQAFLDAVLESELSETAAASLRVMVVLASDAIYTYSHLDAARQELYERQFEAPIYARRCTRAAIAQRLRYHHYPEDALDDLMEATSGWTQLLDRLFENVSNANPRVTARELREQIVRPKLSQAFLKGAGVQPDTVMSDLLRFLITYPFNLEDFDAATIRSFGLEIDEEVARVMLVHLRAIDVVRITERNQIVVDPLISKLITGGSHA